ncbi:hypothetical protein SBV1_570001 [Verrucomicrobia bacterium]|nr:hypothetical protein SBV1_570001 [Verrucomicrobiota bacterium]
MHARDLLVDSNPGGYRSAWAPIAGFTDSEETAQLTGMVMGSEASGRFRPRPPNFAELAGLSMLK